MLFNRIKGYWNLLRDLNISKTLYFNFKVFPWQKAIKLPVYFFGPVKFVSLKGKVELELNSLSRGMIQFGCKEENIIATREPTRISIDGELIFKGKCKFGHAVQLLTWKNGKLIVGDNGWVGSFSKLISFRTIEIGDDFLGSWDCQIFDTNFHFIENSVDGSISDPNGKVLIGRNCWLGNRATVLKNTVIPDDCIIATGSVCNKDYTNSCPAGSVIGGMPAAFIKAGVKYINDKKLEKKLFNYFQNPDNYDTTVNRNSFGN